MCSIFFFLLVHVLDTALVRVSPEAYNAVIGTYKTPIMGLGEAGLVAAIVFHALNGLRIILVDFWAKGPRYQRQMFWVVIGLFVVLFVPFAIRHLTHVLRRGAELMTATATVDDHRRRVRKRPRSPAAPSSRGNFEMWGWIFMRGSGVLLVVLIFGHLFVNLMVGEGIHAIDFALRRRQVGQPVLAGLGPADALARR